MRGEDQRQGAMFSYVSLEQRVPGDHPLRKLLPMVNEALAELSPRFESLYSRVGRPSIAEVIIEVTSLKTQEEDLYEKKPLYERIGVEEYLLFDPYREYLRPRLQGYRLEGRRYQPIPLGDYDSLPSRTTGLTFRPEELHLRMIDSATKKPLWRIHEIAAELARAEARTRAALDWLAAEIEARQVAEAKIAGGRAARRSIEERIRILEDEVRRLRQGRSG